MGCGNEGEAPTKESETKDAQGERTQMMTADNKVIFNEIIVYVFVGLFCVSTGLVGWLCLKTVDLSEKSTAIIEQNKNIESRMAEFRQELQEYREVRAKELDRITYLEISAARHGWENK
jgi:hypothetical protein